MNTIVGVVLFLAAAESGPRTVGSMAMTNFHRSMEECYAFVAHSVVTEPAIALARARLEQRFGPVQDYIFCHDMGAPT